MDSEANMAVTEQLPNETEVKPKLSIEEQRKFERGVYLQDLNKILRARHAAVLRNLIGQLTGQLEKIEDGHISSPTLDQPEIMRVLENAALQFDPKIALHLSNEVNGNFSTAINGLLEDIRHNPVLDDGDKAELLNGIKKSVGGGFDYKM